MVIVMEGKFGVKTNKWPFQGMHNYTPSELAILYTK